LEDIEKQFKNLDKKERNSINQSLVNMGIRSDESRNLNKLKISGNMQ
jgi:hypothetical protein